MKIAIPRLIVVNMRSTLELFLILVEVLLRPANVLLLQLVQSLIV